MAATFIVEDGTGKSDANSYESAANADAYWENYAVPTAWSGLSLDADKEKHLRIATQWLDAKFRLRMKGRRVYPDTQALQYPRSGVVSHDGHQLRHDVIPDALKHATIEAAAKSAAGELMVDVTATDANLEMSEVKVGPITIKEGFSGSKAVQTTYSLVEALLSDLINPAGRLTRS